MAVTIEQAPGPAGANAVSLAETALGCTFPADYRHFLLTHNGGRPRPRGFDIQWQAGQAAGESWRTSSLSWFYELGVPDSVVDLLEENQVSFRDRLPQGTLAFASDAGGNQMLLALAGPFAGKVLFWCKDHEVGEGGVPGYDNVGIVADSFQDLLDHRLR